MPDWLYNLVAERKPRVSLLDRSDWASRRRHGCDRLVAVAASQLRGDLAACQTCQRDEPVSSWHGIAAAAATT
jgi:hypothetical protein